MSVRVCRRFECDRPGCRFSEYSPHGDSARARAQMRLRGWTILRWKHKPGAGAGHLVVLCAVHARWRPRTGREYPPGRIGRQDYTAASQPFVPLGLLVKR